MGVYHTGVVDEEHLSAGDMVWIYHAETEAFLDVASMHSSVVKVSSVTVAIKPD